MEFNKIINSNYFLVNKLGSTCLRPQLPYSLRNSLKTTGRRSLTYSTTLNNPFHVTFLQSSLLKHSTPSSLPSSRLQPSTSLILSKNYTPLCQKEYFSISRLSLKEVEKSSEKIHRQARNDVLAPPLTEEQIAKHEKEKEIYQKIRKFEHYNYFRSISKTSYYDSLDIDEEDKKLSWVDRLLHRYFRRRRIQTKYNSRNLNRGLVYVKPAKEAEKTTDICECTEDKSPRELMVLLGWWNCHPKHLRKYIKLYSEMGHPVLAHISPTLLLVVPKILNIKNEHLMKQMFQFWRQHRAKGQEYKIMFHTFSDNGSYVFAHFTYVLQVNLRKYKKKMKVREQRLLEKLNLGDSITVLSTSPAITSSSAGALKGKEIRSLAKPLPSPLSTTLSTGSTASSGPAKTKTLMTEKEFLTFLDEKEKKGEWKADDRIGKLVAEYRQAQKDYKEYEDFYFCMEAAIMDSGPSLLTQSVITRGITAGITSMKCMKYLGVKHTHYSPALSKMICYFYLIYVRQPSIAKYLLDIYYPAFYNVPKHMAYMFMYGNGDRVICPDLIEPYIYNLQKNGFLVRRAYFEGSDHVMHFVVHREVYEAEVKKFIHDIREHSRIEQKSGVRVIYDEKTGIIQDHEKILIPDKRKSNIKSIWERAISDEEHFRFLGIIPKRSAPPESMKEPFTTTTTTTTSTTTTTKNSPDPSSKSK